MNESTSVAALAAAENELFGKYKYPIVRLAETVVGSDDALLKDLLGLEPTQNGIVGLVIGFGWRLKKCVVVNELGAVVEFFLKERNHQLLHPGLVNGFSEPLSLWNSDTELWLRINTEPGVWYREPHPAADEICPGQGFVPLRQRLRRHPDQMHDSGGREGDRCQYCHLEPGDWPNQAVCLNRSYLLDSAMAF
jgi:hypothetical protein